MSNPISSAGFNRYSPSGRVSPLFFVYLGLALIVAIIAAFVYQLGLYWIPFIYVNFLLTGAMGLLVGMVGSFVVNQGKARSILLALLGAVVLTLAGLGAKFWFQYQRDYNEQARAVEALKETGFAELQQELAMELGQDAMGASEASDTSGQDGQLPEEAKAEFIRAIDQQLEQYTFAAHLQQRVDDGWLVGKGKGMPISGVFVYLIWLIEAGAILGIGGMMMWESASQPFSEKLGQWASESEVVMSLPVSDPAMIEKIQAANSVDQLLEIPIPKDDQSNQIAVYTVNSIPGQEMEDAYLSVELQTHKINSKGEAEVDKKNLVKFAVLSSQQRYQLRDNASLLQEAIQAYQASRAQAGQTEAAVGGDGSPADSASSANG